MPFLDGRTRPRRKVSLRPYQDDATARVDDRIARGVRRILLVAPCGAGKTTIAAAIIVACLARGERVLFLAHGRELIAQAYQRLVDLGIPEEDIGVIMADDPRHRPDARVQVASVDTLRHRDKPLADVVFIDEAHRAVARSYRTIAAFYPDAIHLGLTATPYRADGCGLRDAFDELLVVATPRALIAGGYLVEPRVLTVAPSDRPDLSTVPLRGGDYDERALGAAVNRAPLVGNIVEHWLVHARGVRTVVFAASVAHSQHIVARFVAAGVRAEHLDGATRTSARDAILARLASGETLVVGSCSTIQEGWDAPSVKCAILARPTKSLGLYLQQVGRIMRPWCDERAIVLDHAGCALEHGLPHADRDFTLDGRARGACSTAREALPIACPACFAVVVRTATACPICTTQLRLPRGLLDETDGSLVELTPDGVDVETWSRLRKQTAARGYDTSHLVARILSKWGDEMNAVAKGEVR